MERDCNKENCKEDSGNCKILDDDKYPLQCIGEWAEDKKHHFLDKYLIASQEVRKDFYKKNNAVFVDLFAGPGKSIVKHEKRIVDSGGLKALKGKIGFNEAYYFDLNKDNIAALKDRTKGYEGVQVIEGNSNITIDSLIAKLEKSPWKYHFAFIDPFGPDNLKFTTVAKLAVLNRMDMLIHFPLGAILRNIKEWLSKNDENTIMDNFMGTTKWRKVINKHSMDALPSILLDMYYEQLKTIGYPEKGLKLLKPEKDEYIEVPFVTVKNTKNVTLYMLIFATKHPLGQKIWNSIIRIDEKGQPKLF